MHQGLVALGPDTELNTDRMLFPGKTAPLLPLQASILEAIIEGQGLSSMTAGKAEEAALLLSGLPGQVATAVSRHLTTEGFERERVMFCEYF